MEGRLIKSTAAFVKRNVSKLLAETDKAIGVISRTVFAYFVKIVPNKVVFITYQNQYTCNPKYITEKLIASGMDLDIVWVVDKKTKSTPKNYEIPDGVRMVLRDSSANYYELMSAKVWVDNAMNCVWKRTPKKKGQYYIETWHGSMGIKRLDTYGSKYWRYVANKCNREFDYMLANSDYEVNIFRTSFWPDVNIVKTGHPRNDMFFDKKQIDSFRSKVINYYGLEENVRFVLYAPTFRDNKDTSCFDIDYEKLYMALQEKYPGNWKILLRLHYHNRGVKKKVDYPEYILNATGYYDMQELMAASDIGITDYSSWIYDYVLMRRPGFIYASDIDLYNTTRGFYYPLEKTPFPIARNTEELCRSIIGFDEKAYQNSVDEFLTRHGCAEDGCASMRVAEKIREVIGNQTNRRRFE